MSIVEVYWNKMVLSTRSSPCCGILQEAPPSAQEFPKIWPLGSKKLKKALSIGKWWFFIIYKWKISITFSIAMFNIIQWYSNDIRMQLSSKILRRWWCERGSSRAGMSSFLTSQWASGISHQTGFSKVLASWINWNQGSVHVQIGSAIGSARPSGGAPALGRGS